MEPDATLSHPGFDAERERRAFEIRQRAARPEMSLARTDGDYRDLVAEALWQGWRERAESAFERLFPVQGGPSPRWSLLAPCGLQAQSNHGMGLEELAERGGVDPFEALDLLLFRPAGHHRAELGASVDAAVARLERALKAADAPSVPEGFAMVSQDASPALLMSMDMRYDHALGMPGYYDQDMFRSSLGGATHAQRLDGALRQMAQLHEEVVGKGFHDPFDEEFHLKLLGKQP